MAGQNQAPPGGGVKRGDDVSEGHIAVRRVGLEAILLRAPASLQRAQGPQDVLGKQRRVTSPRSDLPGFPFQMGPAHVTPTCCAERLPGELG